jgi:hypothetical protein
VVAAVKAARERLAKGISFGGGEMFLAVIHFHAGFLTAVELR